MSDPLDGEKPITTADERRRLDGAVMSSLDPRIGESVLVCGCGVGRLALTIARAVGPDGHVLGVDHRPALVAVARRRAAATAQARFISADPAGLGLAAESFDRALVDAGTADLDDPAIAIGRTVAAVRRGGFVVATAPDWSTLTLNVSDIHLTHRLATVIDRGPGAPRLGRLLAGLFATSNVAVTSQASASVSARSWGDLVLVADLPSRVGRAVADGALDLNDADALLAALETAQSAGEILATLTTTIVTGRRV